MKLIYGPDAIFKKSSIPVETIDDDVLDLCGQLEDLLYRENAVGVAAPMIGVLKQVIAVDLQEGGKNNLLVMINPVIEHRGNGIQIYEEASICFPGISAEIERPKEIEVAYLTPDGVQEKIQADGFLATVIQHEMDYLMGKTFLDYLSPMKRKMLLKKVKKYKQQI